MDTPTCQRCTEPGLTRTPDKYEVESGQLTLKSKNFVPVAAEDLAERSVMKELQTTYGKVSYPAHSVALRGLGRSQCAFSLFDRALR